MDIRKVATFIRELKIRSSKGELQWEAGKPDTYYIIINDVKVSVELRDNTEGPFDEIDYFVRFDTLEGKFIEEYSDSDLKNYLQNSAAEMSELYKNARLRALGLDKKLEETLNYFSEL